MAELLPDLMDGRIEPGRVFDRTVDLAGVPEGYGAMNEREALKVPAHDRLSAETGIGVATRRSRGQLAPDGHQLTIGVPPLVRP